jgi:hypothetical protein
MIDILEFITRCIIGFFGIIFLFGLFAKWFGDKNFDIFDMCVVLFAIMFLLFAFGDYN